MENKYAMIAVELNFLNIWETAKIVGDLALNPKFVSVYEEFWVCHFSPPIQTMICHMKGSQLFAAQSGAQYNKYKLYIPIRMETVHCNSLLI